LSYSGAYTTVEDGLIVDDSLIIELRVASLEEDSMPSDELILGTGIIELEVMLYNEGGIHSDKFIVGSSTLSTGYLS
jgi:hypothetical protein